MSRKTQKHPGSEIVSDFHLWVNVSRSVKPADQDTAKQLQDFIDKNNNPVAREKLSTTIRPSKTMKQDLSVLKTSTAPALNSIDKKLQRQFLRGKVEIDAQLDLHGETLLSAREKLYHFLSRCVSRSCKTVLVITGKGESQFARHTLHSRDFHHSSERTGRLRTAVPEWLYEEKFRQLASGFQPAHPRHGGGGALYIRLRRHSKRG